MNKLLKSLLLIAICKNSLFALSYEEITYPTLLANPYTDHVQHFQKLFQHKKVESLLEFGIGYGTKYLLENCNHVTSCEIILPHQNSYWFYHVTEVCSKNQNWTPLLVCGSSCLQSADSFSVREHKNPALQDPSFLEELKKICDDLFAKQTFDVAFVDPGFHMRGDLVNELFNRTPIIVAHDTNGSHEIYGWNRINTPPSYEKIIFTEGQGIIFWIEKKQTDLIDALKKIQGNNPE